MSKVMKQWEEERYKARVDGSMDGITQAPVELLNTASVGGVEEALITQVVELLINVNKSSPPSPEEQHLIFEEIFIGTISTGQVWNCNTGTYETKSDEAQNP
jgi:hypothetical protein